MKYIIEWNYDSIFRRGLITNDTTDRDFVMKLEEEVQEFTDALLHSNGDINEELSDVILVCLNFARHNGIDIEKELINKIKINSNRE